MIQMPENGSFNQEYNRFRSSILPTGDSTPLKPSPPPESVDAVTKDSQLTAPTRDEMDSKLAAVEARMDARVVRIQSLVESVAKDLERSILQSQESANHYRSLKIVTITTAFASVVGIVGLVAAIFGSMVASFDSGRDTSAVAAAARQHVEEMSAANNRMQAETQQLLQDAIRVMNQSLK